MMTTTAVGVRKATESERRYTVVPIHIPEADARAAERMRNQLEGMLSHKTPDIMRGFLASPDILVTNEKDKDVLLPVVERTNEHVRSDIYEPIESTLSSELYDMPPDELRAALDAVLANINEDVLPDLIAYIRGGPYQGRLESGDDFYRNCELLLFVLRYTSRSMRLPK